MQRLTKKDFLSKALFRLHCFGFAFTPKLIPTIGFILVLPFLLKLGFWQMDRAEYKQLLKQQFETRTLETPKTLAQLHQNTIEKQEYYPITLSGHYDNQHQFLLDNRMHNHRVGFEVLTPFIPNKGKKVLLINRGWIPGTGDRRKLPFLKTVKGQQTVQGLMKLPPKKTFVLSHQINTKKWPLLIQTINLKKLGGYYHKPLYPFIVLLSPKAQHGFTREWKRIMMPSHKHIGYAFQWFALALTLVIIYLLTNIRSIKRTPRG